VDRTKQGEGCIKGDGGGVIVGEGGYGGEGREGRRTQQPSPTSSGMSTPE